MVDLLLNGKIALVTGAGRGIGKNGVSATAPTHGTGQILVIVD
jgi:NAD(P)-dependent dehydrogenase (short-subunit alcohol dehydrogenase family)